MRLLLAPLAREDVKTVRCLGLNYEQHAKEVRKLDINQSQIVPNTTVVKHAPAKIPNTLL